MNEIIKSVNGQEFVVGCLPRTSKVGDGEFKVLGEDSDSPIKVLTSRERDKLEDPDIISFIWHVINQANQGSCCGAAACGLVMLLRAMAGLKKLIMSQASLYGQGNGGRDQGMAIDTCLRKLSTVGACPTSVIEQYDWHGFRRKTWMDGWEKVAAKYRIMEWWDCPTYDHIATANKYGMPVIYGAKGHAVCRLKPRKDLNSWDYSWGDNGVGEWATVREMKYDVPRYGAWAGRVMFDPPGDGDVPVRKAT